jgi:aminobenzoyl-glutamate transport protein
MSLINRCLGAVERWGNKLPDPVTLFLLLIAVTLLISAAVSLAGWQVVHPASGQPVQAVNLLSGPILARVLTEMPSIFAGFPPLGLVLTVMLGIGVAEKSGLVACALRRLLADVPRALLSAAVVFAGIMSSLAADAGYVVLIPLGALLFASAGRHPLAGLAATFAGVSAGFSANLVLTSLDPLLAGFTQSSAQLLVEGIEVNAAANYYLMIALVPVLTIGGALLTDYFVEPRLPPMPQISSAGAAGLSDRDRRGLRLSGISLVGMLGLAALLVVPENGILRDENGGTGPFFHALIALMFFFFLIPGLVFGISTGTIRSDKDAVAMSSESMSDMGMYIVLAFVAAHFIALFSWSNLGIMLAISGANLMDALGFTGIPLILFFILIVALINLFVGSASAKWAILGPVFVPMLMLLGYSPEMAQAAYRIGDSTTNILTPLLPYFPLILVFSRRYQREYGIGNLVALMLPYSIVFGLLMCLVLVLWMLLGLPLGPGSAIHFQI